MELTWDQLLVEARARGRRWGGHFFRLANGSTSVFPSMLDRGVNGQAHALVADIRPLDALGDALVEECYRAAVAAFTALVHRDDGCPLGQPGQRPHQ